MIRHVGELIRDDPELLAYAERVWASQEFKDWKRAVMGSRVVDGIKPGDDEE